jgi:predicted RNA-binding protein YlqC (UPF0109 family)
MQVDALDSQVCTFLHKIVAALVDQTDAVQITQTPQPDGVSFRIVVHD